MFCINIHLYIHNIIHISLAGFQRNENISQLKWTLMVTQMLQYVRMLSWSLREWRVLKVGEMLLTCGIPVSVDSMKDPEQNVNSFRRWLVSTGQAKTIQDHHAAWPTPAAPVHHQHQSSKHGTSPQMQGCVGGEGDTSRTPHHGWNQEQMDKSVLMILSNSCSKTRVLSRQPGKPRL